MVKMPFFLPTVFGAPIGGDPKGISSNAFALKKLEFLGHYAALIA